jgi:hypothetical protein
MSESAISRIWRAFALQPHRPEPFDVALGDGDARVAAAVRRTVLAAVEDGFGRASKLMWRAGASAREARTTQPKAATQGEDFLGTGPTSMHAIDINFRIERSPRH